RSSAIDLPEHDVERAEDRGYVGEHVAPAEEIHGLEVGKAGRPDFALVGLVAAVGDEIDAELALGRLDRGVDLARGNVKAFGVKLEVVDERLHGALHLGALGRDDLVVDHRDRPLPFARGELLQALLHDLGRLAHLLHADAIAVVIVAVLTHGDVEIELGVAFIGLRLAQIPCRARSAHHHAGEAPSPRIGERDHADVDVTLLEDTVVGEQALEIIADLEERIAKRGDVVDELRGQILVYAADAEIGGMQAAAGGALVEAHELFTLFKAPERRRERA